MIDSSDKDFLRPDQNHKSFFTSPMIVALLLSTMLILLQLSGWHKNFSVDEPSNLHYGKDFLTTGPLAKLDMQKMPILALNALGCVSYGCDPEKTTGHPWRRFWIRLPSVLFTLALGLLAWYWCRCLYGPSSAMGALLLYVFNPTLLAHGKQITSDVTTSFFVVLTVFFFWKWRASRKERFFYFSAIATGFAILSKFSSILLLFILPLIMILPNIFRKKHPFDGLGFLETLKKSALFLLLIWFVINSAYLFQGSFESTRSYVWKSRFYQNISKVDFPIPFPRIFVQGLDISHFIEENDHYGRGNNYILGHRHRKGRDYAFPLMILFKTPLAFFVILLIALIPCRSCRTPRDDASPAPYLWIPFAAWLVFFSSFCDVQIGIRYILPGYVFLIIFAGKAFQDINSKRKAAVLAAASFWYVLSVLSYHPHYIPYFNELIGDRINAYKYLADSNLDWEDKSYYIKKWETSHPKLLYQTRLEATTNPQPGFFLLAANDYVGVNDQDLLAWIREIKPISHVAYSHYLLYVTAEELALALKKNPIPRIEK